MFDFRNFARFAYLWFLRSRWSARRALVSVAFVALVPVWELVIWLTLLLDEVLYPRYRRQPVTSPVFITGYFRSGTTHLHRLMAGDRRRFASASMWEILFAPSILLRRLAAALAALDRCSSYRLSRRWRRDVEAGWRVRNPMHEVSLFAPEEDEYLMLHLWSALTIGLSAGLLDLARPYVHFDHALPRGRRARIMHFYRRCIQRHLHAGAHRSAGRQRQYLAKNPALCPKLDSLLTEFPDARVVHLMRNPLESVPSFLSMMRFSWDALGVPRDDEALRAFIVEMAVHWYRYPLERLAELPAERYIVIRYDELISAPKATIERIYAHFGFEMDPAFEDWLEREARHARDYRSRHGYSMDELGLSQTRLLAELAAVMRRFGFEAQGAGTRGPEG